eukprot:7760947-Prorocentrum_lima.AAC.1
MAAVVWAVLLARSVPSPPLPWGCLRGAVSRPGRVCCRCQAGPAVLRWRPVLLEWWPAMFPGCSCQEALGSH